MVADFYNCVNIIQPAELVFWHQPKEFLRNIPPDPPQERFAIQTQSPESTARPDPEGQRFD
jgi:hypothetical protein